MKLERLFGKTISLKRHWITKAVNFVIKNVRLNIRTDFDKNREFAYSVEKMEHDDSNSYKSWRKVSCAKQFNNDVCQVKTLRNVTSNIFLLLFSCLQNLQLLIHQHFKLIGSRDAIFRLRNGESVLIKEKEIDVENMNYNKISVKKCLQFIGQDTSCIPLVAKNNRKDTIAALIEKSKLLEGTKKNVCYVYGSLWAKFISRRTGSFSQIESGIDKPYVVQCINATTIQNEPEKYWIELLYRKKHHVYQFKDFLVMYQTSIGREEALNFTEKVSVYKLSLAPMIKINRIMRKHINDITTWVSLRFSCGYSSLRWQWHINLWKYHNGYLYF